MKKHSLFVCFLLILSLLLSSALPSFAAQSSNTGTIYEKLDTLATTISSSLESAFVSTANELEEQARQYKASGDILQDANGNDIDMDALCELYTNNAVALRGFSHGYDADKLALVSYLYELTYIQADKFRPMSEVTLQMTWLMGTEYYLDMIDTGDMLDQLLIRVYSLALGDKYASYLTKEQLEEDTSITYGGIGVTVISRADGYADVVSITKDSPAENVGILPGDIITKVDGEDFAEIGYNNAIYKVRGEVGTSVLLTARRNGQEYTVSLTRALLTNYSVTYRMLEDGETGYIHISEFSQGTFDQFVEAVETLEKDGAAKFVFDVRNNPGGSLEVILAILEYITPDDTDLPLIRMEYKDSSQNQNFYSVFDYYPTASKFAAAKNHAIYAPMVVLCNSYTASAGELFTSCLKDFGCAEVIGETTYGKGTGQTGYMLYNGDYVNISTFYYAPPTSDNYEGKGITPDQIVPLPDRVKDTNFYLLSYEDDTQLQAAVAFLETKEGDTTLSGNKLPTPTPFFKSDAFFVILLSGLGMITVALVALLVLFVRRRNSVLKDVDYLFTDSRTFREDPPSEKDHPTSPTNEPPSGL